MRSALLLAALALAGCERGPPAEKVTPVEVKPSPAETTPTLPAVAPASTPTPEQRFQALGNEPFWSVFVEGDRLRYATPESIEGTSFPARRTVEGEAQVWTGTFEGSKFTLRIAPGTCSDGMSDTVYAWTSQVTFADKALQGCARLE